MVEILKYIPCGFLDFVAREHHIHSLVDRVFYLNSQYAGVSVKILSLAFEPVKAVSILKIECGDASHNCNNLIKTRNLGYTAKTYRVDEKFTHIMWGHDVASCCLRRIETKARMRMMMEQMSIAAEVECRMSPMPTSGDMMPPNRNPAAPNSADAAPM